MACSLFTSRNGEMTLLKAEEEHLMKRDGLWATGKKVPEKLKLEAFNVVADRAGFPNGAVTATKVSPKAIPDAKSLIPS